MTITCKEAARMISEGLDRELPADEKLRLHAHLLVCRGCAAVRERMEFLRRALRGLSDRDEA